MENDIINIISIRKKTDENFTDFITIVKFNITITHLEITDTIIGEIYLGYPAHEGSQYTEYSNVAESQVIEWIKNTPEYIILRGDLEHKIWIEAQQEITDFPWN